MREKLRIRNAIILLVILGLTAGATVLLYRWQAQRNVAGIVELADAAREKKRYDRAAMLYSRYLERVPGDHAVRAKLGMMMEDIARTPRQRAGVADTYENVLKEDPENSEVRRRLISLYIRSRNFSRALPHLEHMSAATSSDVELLTSLAACKLELGDAAEAVKLYQKVIELDPTRLTAYLQAATVLRRSPANNTNPEPNPESVKQADQLIDQMVAANPSSAAALLNRVRYKLAFSTGDAEPDLKAAVELAPGDIEVLLSAAAFAKNPDDSRRYLDDALKIAQSDERVYLAMALLDINQGRLREAVDLLKSASIKLPGNPRVLFTLAETMLLAGMHAEMDPVLAEINRWKLPAEQTLILRGRQKMAEGNWQAAKDILEAGRPSFTTEAASLAAEVDVLLGRCYMELNEYEPALAAYRRAVAGDPRRADAMENVGRLLVLLGRTQEAVESYRQVATAADASIQSLIGYARLRTLQFLNAPPNERNAELLEPIFKRVTDRMPDSEEITLLRADVLAADGKADAAEALLRSAMEKQPKSTQLGLSLARLLIRGGKQAEADALLDQLERDIGSTLEIVLFRIERMPTASHPNAAKMLQTAEALLAKLPPDDQAELMTALAEAQIRWENLPEAQRWIDRVIQLRPRELSYRFKRFELAALADNQADMERLAHEIQQIEGPAGPVGSFAQALTRLSRAENHTPLGLREARQFLDTAIRLRPNWHNPVTSLGLIADIEGNYEQALKHYRRAVDLGERRTAVIRRLLQLYSGLRRYPEAAPLLQLLNREGFVSTEMLKLSAEMSLAKNEGSQAVDQALKVIDANSKNFEDHLWKAEILASVGKNEEAAASFRNALDLAGTSGAPLVGYVRFLVRTNQREQAAELIATASGNIPEPEKTITLAQCHDALGNVEAAEKAYKAAIQAQPGDFDVIRQFVDFNQRIGKPAASIPVLKAMLTGKLPEENAIPIRLALAFGLAGSGSKNQFEEALQLLDQNIAAEPDNLAHKMSKAKILSTRPGHAREALLILQQAPQNRLDPDEQFLLGRLLFEIGNVAEGRRVLIDLIARSGDNPAYIGYFADQLLQENQLTEAETWIRQLERNSPNELGTLRVRGIALIRSNRIGDALALIRSVADAQPQSQRGTNSLTPARRAALLADELSKLSPEAGVQLADAAANYFRKSAAEGSTPKLELIAALGRHGNVREAVEMCRAERANAGAEQCAQILFSIMFSTYPFKDSDLDALETEIRTCLDGFADASITASLRGLLSARRARYPEAAAEFRKAVAANPNDLDSINNLAYMLILTGGSPAEIATLLEKALQLGGLTPELRDTRGMAHLAANRTSEAISDLESAVNQQPNASRCLHLASAYAKAGRKDDARRMLTRAERLQTDGTLVIPAEQELLKRLATELK